MLRGPQNQREGEAGGRQAEGSEKGNRRTGQARRREGRQGSERGAKDWESAAANSMVKEGRTAAQVLAAALPQLQLLPVKAGHGMHEPALQAALQQAAADLHSNLLPTRSQ